MGTAGRKVPPKGHPARSNAPVVESVCPPRSKGYRKRLTFLNTPLSESSSDCENLTAKSRKREYLRRGVHAMARLARVVAADVPHHVTQRGNARRFILRATRTGVSIYRVEMPATPGEPHTLAREYRETRGRSPRYLNLFLNIAGLGFGERRKVLGLYLERPRAELAFGLLLWALQIQRLEGSLSGCQYYGFSMGLGRCGRLRAWL